MHEDTNMIRAAAQYERAGINLYESMHDELLTDDLDLAP